MRDAMPSSGQNTLPLCVTGCCCQQIIPKGISNSRYIVRDPILDVWTETQQARGSTHFPLTNPMFEIATIRALCKNPIKMPNVSFHKLSSLFHSSLIGCIYESAIKQTTLCLSLNISQTKQREWTLACWEPRDVWSEAWLVFGWSDIQIRSSRFAFVCQDVPFHSILSNCYWYLLTNKSEWKSNRKS